MRRIVAAVLAIIIVALLVLLLRQGRQPGLPKGMGLPEPGPLQSQVQTLLTESSDAWNAGDLDAFMASYLKDPSTTYIGSTGLLRGYDAIRDHYAPSFEPGAARDSLRFEDLYTRPLGPGLGLAVAHYVLYRSDTTTSTRIFTLILQQTPDGWGIVHDHSNALSE